MLMSKQNQEVLRNAMTVDVEDYFQVSAFAPYIARGDWEGCECRVERNIERILALFDKHGTKATFFTLGWIAERYPQIVRDIVAQGHELASHGYGHERASDLSPQAFREDLLRAKKLLEDLGGQAVRGYRAEFLHRQGQSLGFRHLAGDRPCLQLQRLSDPARPLRHAGFAALRLSGA